MGYLYDVRHLMGWGVSRVIQMVGCITGDTCGVGLVHVVPLVSLPVGSPVALRRLSGVRLSRGDVMRGGVRGCLMGQG